MSDFIRGRPDEACSEFFHTNWTGTGGTTSSSTCTVRLFSGRRQGDESQISARPNLETPHLVS
ncbi:MAG: hypothetical protein MUF81_19550 [Verrucomicrobia bacterium]|nr:hypothetical protein [Verrucomicrobiota bacterium]